jgi:histidinol phosphatase-like enzyme
MLETAIRRWGLDPAGCALIGDQPSDMAAAAGAGVGLAIQMRSEGAMAGAAAAVAAFKG